MKTHFGGYNRNMDINLYQSEDDINQNVITNPLHLFVQEIELAVKIVGGIFGAKYYIDLERFVFNQRINATTIKNEIDTFISENCEGAKKFPYQTTVEILKVENKDLIYISVSIYDRENDKDFVQKFTVSV